MQNEEEQRQETTLTLTANEKQVLIQLIDLAVKAGGLNVAEVALHFMKKLEDK